MATATEVSLADHQVLTQVEVPSQVAHAQEVHSLAVPMVVDFTQVDHTRVVDLTQAALTRVAALTLAVHMVAVHTAEVISEATDKQGYNSSVRTSAFDIL